MREYIKAFLKEKPFFFSIVRPKEAFLFQKFKPFKKPVLDLGCGDGFFTEVAFGKLDAGIDPDTNATHEAKKRKIYTEIKKYNGRKIPYKSAVFSTIVSNSTLEHIYNIDEVLAESSRVLKKGGMFYFTTITDIWPDYIYGSKILGNGYKRYFTNKSKHYNLFSYKEWKKRLEKNSFEVIEYQHYLDNKKIYGIFELSHYISIPSLLTKRLFNKWVVFPAKINYMDKIIKWLIYETKADNRIGPCLFIAAKKIH